MDATFPKQLLQHARVRPDALAMREKEFGIWQTYTWRQLADLTECAAIGLQAAGLQRGDCVAVVGANRPRLYVAMLAVQSLGAIPVPLYQDAAATELIFPLSNANVRMCIVEDQEQVDKMLEVRAEYPSLRHIWYDDPRGLRNYDEPGLERFASLLEYGSARREQSAIIFHTEIARGRADDTAAVFFTSGTTGKPKGVVHTHASLLDRAMAGARFDRLGNDEDVLAYLPPAWIGQNIFSYAQWLACGYIVNCPESAATVAIDMREVGPSYYFAPPRIFENLLTSVTIRMEDAGRTKRKLFEYFMKVARDVGPRRMAGAPLTKLERMNYALGDIIIYGPLRNTLGLSRVRVAYTAGEAIGPDLFTFYRSIGVNLKQLYGQTETAVFVCMQPDRDARSDTVGLPIEGVEIKVADNGEVLVRSPGLLKGYFKNEAATAEVLTADGWYHTSDAGFLDASGHLKIIDRVKDVGRLKGGAHDRSIFAPKYVENKLKFFPYVKEVVAYGDGRSTVCVMVNIDFEAVGNWAERRNLSYAGYTDLAQKQEVYRLMQDCVERVNADLAQDEMLAGSQISRFLILHKELDADDNELTRTNKVRRGFIADKYRPLIDALYSGETEKFIETQVKYEDGRVGSISATLKLRDAKLFTQVKTAA